MEGKGMEWKGEGGEAGMEGKEKVRTREGKGGVGMEGEGREGKGVGGKGIREMMRRKGSTG